jgi:type IV secretion system protein VirB10
MRLNAPSSFFAAGDAGADNKLLSNLISPQNKIATIFSEHSMNSEFSNKKVDVDTVTATQISHPTTTIAQGELIQAILETPINSDLPGMVRAVTNQPVYAYTGNQALIPAGARLIGQYSSGIVQGQSRVMILWNRIILPDGTSAQLHSPGTDDQGISGQGADSINRHFWAQFGEATLLSILSAGAATAGVNGDDQYNSLAYYRSTMAQSLNDTASNVIDKSINIKPTLIIHQGTKINVFVARDLDLDAVVNHD